MPSAKSRVKKISNLVSFENFENLSGRSLLIVKTNISTRGIRKGIKFEGVINPVQSWLGLGEWLHTSYIWLQWQLTLYNTSPPSTQSSISMVYADLHQDICAWGWSIWHHQQHESPLISDILSLLAKDSCTGSTRSTLYPLSVWTVVICKSLSTAVLIDDNEQFM